MSDQAKKTYQEFAKAIKKKYPTYADVDDYTLAQRIVEKYPVYANQVDLKKKEEKEDTLDSSLDQDSTVTTTTEDPQSSTGVAGETESKISNEKKIAANNFAKLIGEPIRYPEVEEEKRPEADPNRPVWAGGEPPKESDSESSRKRRSSKESDVVDLDPEMIEGKKKRDDRLSRLSVEERARMQRLSGDVEDESDDFFRNTDAFLTSLKIGTVSLASNAVGALGGLSQMKYGANPLSQKLLDIASTINASMEDERLVSAASILKDLDESPEEAMMNVQAGIYDLAFGNEEEGTERDVIDAIKLTGLAITESVPYMLGIGATGGSSLAMGATGTALGYGGSVVDEYARDGYVDDVDQLQSIATGLVEGTLNLISGRAEKSINKVFKSALSKGVSRAEIKELLTSPLRNASKGALGEAVEEGLQGLGGYYIGSIDGDYEFDPEEAKKITLESILVGMGSGGLFSGAGSYAASRSIMNSEPKLHSAIRGLDEEIKSQKPDSKVAIAASKKKKELQKRQRDLFIKKAGFIARLPEDVQIKAGHLAVSISELEIAESEALKQETKDQLREDIDKKQEEFNKLVNDREENNRPQTTEQVSSVDAEPESEVKTDDGEAGTRTDTSDRSTAVDQTKVSSEEIEDEVKIIPYSKERRASARDKATSLNGVKLVDSKTNETGNKELGRLVSSLSGQNDGDGVLIATVDNYADLEALLLEELTQDEVNKLKNEDGQIEIDGVYLEGSSMVVVDTRAKDDNVALHEAVHPIMNKILLENTSMLDQLVNDAIANDESGVFNPVVTKEGDKVSESGRPISDQKYSPIEEFMLQYRPEGRETRGTLENLEGVVEGLARALRTSIDSDNKTWIEQAKLFIDRMLVNLGINRDIVIKSDDDYVSVISKLQKGFETGRKLRAESKSDRVADNNYKTSDFIEIKDGRRFSEAQNNAISKRGEDKLQVDPITPEEAQKIIDDGGRLFISEDNSAGAYVKADGYMGGLFKDPTSTKSKAAKALQDVRVKVGGKFFDAFATHLEDIYIENGFRPVARMEFNEEFAPAGWQDSNLKSKPDNVFFVYDPNGEYKKGDGVRVEDYNEAYEYAKGFKPSTQPSLRKSTKPKTGQQNAEFFTGKAKEASSNIPYKPVLDVDQNTPVAKSYNKFTEGGNFTGHISKMIAGFAEKQMKVAQAVVDLNVDSFLDIGTSEGGLPKTIGENSPNMRVVGIDPNPTMKSNFDKIPAGNNVEYRMEALGASWTEKDPETGRDVQIKEFKPKEKFDVVNEDYVFQFISNDRKGQVADVKKIMNEGGVFITSEKFFTKNFDKNEEKKADHQSKYFSEAERDKDQEEIIVGMSDDMVKDTEYMNILKDNFEYVHEFWNSGNFKGFIASDDLAKLQSMIDSMGDLSSEFSDPDSQTKGNVETASPKTASTDQVFEFPSKPKSGDVLASGRASFKKRRMFVKGTEVKSEKLGNLPVKDINDILKSTDGRFILINSDPTGADGVRLFGGVGYQAFEKNIKDNIGFAASSMTRVESFQNKVKEIAPNGEPISVFVMIQAEKSMFGNAQASELFVNKLSEIGSVRGNVVKMREDLLRTSNLNAIKSAFKSEQEFNNITKAIKSIKLGDKESINSLFNILGEKSFITRGDFIRNFFPDNNAKKRPNGFIKGKLYDEGLTKEVVYEKIGEKDFVGKEWGYIASGFITDSSVDMTSDKFQSGGVKHPLFNAKFYGKDPFILSAHYNVNEAFGEFEFEGSRLGVRGSVAQSFYVGGTKERVDSTPVGKPESILDFKGRKPASFKKSSKGKDDTSKRIRQTVEDSQAFLANKEIADKERADKKRKKQGVAIGDVKGFKWMTQELKEFFQDEQARLKNFQKALSKSLGKNISDDADLYTKLELMKSKALFKVRQIHWEVTSMDNPNSIFRRVTEAGLDVETLGKYMAAIHAPERNKSIREGNEELFVAQEAKIKKTEKQIAEAKNEKTEKKLQNKLNRQREELAVIANKAVKANGGMTDQEATEFLSTLSESDKKKYAEFSKEYRENVTERILLTKLDAGLISEEAFDQMNKFDFYVPMKVDEFNAADRVASEMKRGISRKTYAIKGTDKYGFNQRTNPVFSGINELAASIIEAEKNDAYSALHILATEFPSDMLKVHEAKVVPKSIKGVKRFVDQTKHEIKDKSVKIFVGGKATYIEVRDPKLRKQLQDPKQVAKFIPKMKLLKGFSIYFRTMNTVANPEFIVSNIIRDVQNAMISANLEIDRSKNKEGESRTGTKAGDAALSIGLTSAGIFKRVAASGMAVRRARANNDYSGKYGQALRELEEEGGITQWMKETDVDAQAQLKELKKSMDSNGRIKSSKLKRMGQHISAVTDATELSSRLATYIVAKEAGLSKQQAASLAKNVTVNFDKKGKFGSAMNMLWLFSNAGLQGSVRTATAVFRSGKVRTIASALILVGAGEAELFELAGEEETYKNIPDWIKERYIIIPAYGIDGGYITIPLPYGFNVFKYFGNNSREYMKYLQQGYGGKNLSELGVDTMKSVLGAFNPFQSATFLQSVSPTIFDPIAQVWENTTFFGTPLTPFNYSGDTRVESEAYYKSTPKAWVDIARYINELSNFDRENSIKGMLDMSPNVYRHLTTSYIGGLPRFLARSFMFAGHTGIYDKPLEAMGQEKFDKSLRFDDIPFSRVLLKELPEGVGLQYKQVDKILNRAGVERISNEETEYFHSLMDAAHDHGVDGSYIRKLRREFIRKQAKLERSLRKRSIRN